MNESKKWKKQNRKSCHLSDDGTFWTRLELRCVQRCTQHRKLQNCQIFDKKNWQRKCQKKGPGFCEYHRLPSTGFPGSRERSTRVTHMVQTRGIERKDPSWPPRINAIDITAIYIFLFVNNVQPYSIRKIKTKNQYPFPHRSYHRHEWQCHIHPSSLLLWDDPDWQHLRNPYHHTPNDKTHFLKLILFQEWSKIVLSGGPPVTWAFENPG